MVLFFVVFLSDSLFYVLPSVSTMMLSFPAAAPPGPLHFCTVPTITTTPESENPVDIAHTCRGPEYDTFVTAMHGFADNLNLHDRTWGRRVQALPTNSRIFMIGNEDTVQIAHALACQHGAQITIHRKHSNLDGNGGDATGDDNDAGVQSIYFASSNSTLVLVTDAGDFLKNVTTEQFPTALQRQTSFALQSFDAMVWGLLHNCGTVSASCPNTTHPLYFAAAQAFDGPMLFIGMMADARAEQSLALRDAIRNTKTVKGPRKLWFISGRRYISQIQKLEGATIYGTGDADNAPKTGKIGHRCTGTGGGHADLLAFDVTEFLFQQLGDAVPLRTTST